MSKVVFVGNVPYNMSEEALIDIFKSAGEVVGFRLVFDRETGKPRGYGFCEFADHETALSAVRNLNGADCGGRPLRIDLADSDPFLEGKTTVRGEIVDAGEHHSRPSWGPGRNKPDAAHAFMAGLPMGTPVPPGMGVADAISRTLATMDPQLLIEILAQTKAFVITHPDQARFLLSSHPQLSYALSHALLLNNIVDPSIVQRMAPSTGMPPPAPQPVSMLPPSYPQVNIPTGYPPMPPPNTVPQVPPPHSAPLLGGMYQQPVPAPPSQPNMYYRPPAPTHPVMPPAQPAPAPMDPTAAVVDPEQRAMLMQVLSMTPEQIAALPPTEQETIRMLRSQLMRASA